MHRTKINDLKKWKLSSKRKPLILLGARQVGKTWLIQEFGKTEYQQMAYVNFERPNAPKNLFANDFNADQIITALNAFCKMKITAKYTLIVFDEIQAAPKGITALKYLHEDSPEYHIVAAGSLLGVNIHPSESFPVGKVDFMKLYAMSFYEFLLAMGETGIAELLENRDWQQVRFIQNQILESYRNDFSKHAPQKILPRINMVWDNIPAQLGKANKNLSTA
jgi:predicted AAA+ superfamily ATPase